MGNELVQITLETPQASAESPVVSESAQTAAEICAPSPAREKTFFIETFGCQMNVHDSEKVSGVLVERGYRPVENHADAKLILYNTCSIREKAAEKVFSHLGAFKKKYRPGEKVIGVLGCVAQQEGGRIFERAPQVSLVCGSASYSKLGELLEQVEAGDKRVTGLSLDTDECFETELTSRENPFRAYITIIEGCDQRCAFCVVPMTRGPERSRPSRKILDDCRRLVNEGYTEIQLLGQIVNNWNDASPARLSFAELLARVAEVEGVRRVRFTTSHPKYFAREVVQAIESHPALCDQLHLPVQSGSDAVLDRMGRQYSREEYLEKIDWIKSARRPISLSTDIIVGFCGETPQNFEQTISLLEEVEYDQVFSFKYSPRPKTVAGGWGDSVPEDEKSARLAEVQERQRQIQLRRNQALIGHEFEVLVEGFQPRTQQAVGRTTSNRTVNFAGSPEWVGRYMNVRVTGAGPNSLVGESLEHCHAERSEASLSFGLGENEKDPSLRSG